MTLETSVGASFVVLKQYVLRKLEEPEPVEPDEDEDDEEYDEEPSALDDGSDEDDPEEDRDQRNWLDRRPPRRTRRCQPER